MSNINLYNKPNKKRQRGFRCAMEKKDNSKKRRLNYDVTIKEH